ncbi:wax ester/triacylglycerol synthase family O-acyltransferase [Nocardia sp. ET3-3]|uniref:Diacylglycerol O-acyltransferase n=1 Tax=Nocardia terrae TaxID=2675851 RepID=A0A7K1V2M9_9NOCA|nr:wax ester/triacylglycerol synthase family O-acyltransferase [Nocardia terrae]MVU80699.1 wax ester/triacylglycerol synthase family O-acyltransferase [Nocardia terrae]
MRIRKRRSTTSPINLPPLDAGWLWLESESNLMHGSILAVFRRPPGTSPEFVYDLVERMRSAVVATKPFDLRLRRKGFGRVWPQWEQVDHVDTNYHVRHSALPWPGTERELGRLVSHIHSVPLDKAHPLWTFDVIEGLSDDRFAVLGKMHHALADGVAGIRLFQHWLSDDPTDFGVAPMWVKGMPPRSFRPAEVPRALMDTTTYRRTLAGWARGLTQPLRAVADGLPALRLAATGTAAHPWGAPRTVLNTPITGHRRVATQSYSLSTFRALADAIDGTINDVVLTVCAGGLRRYLSEIDALPSRALTTNIPVSTRARDSTRQVGNSISWAMVPLPTHLSDPCARTEVVRASTRKAKERLDRIRGAAINTYTLAVTTPILLEQVCKLGGRTRPYFNVPISNVPGPRTPMFLDGAELVDIHASTVIYHGQALNIVCLSYGDKLEFSFTACSTALPQVQRLAVHCGEELALLESLYADQPAAAVEA